MHKLLLPFCFHFSSCHLSHSVTFSLISQAQSNAYSFIAFTPPHSSSFLPLSFTILNIFSHFLPPPPIFLLTFPLLFLFPILWHFSFPPLHFLLLFLPPHYFTFPIYLFFFLSPLLPQYAWSSSRKSAGALIAAPLADVNWRWHLLNTELQPSFCIFPLSGCIRRDVTTRKLEAIEESGSHRDHCEASMKHWRGW